MLIKLRFDSPPRLHELVRRPYPRGVFTGLIQALGRVNSLVIQPNETRLVIGTGVWPHRPELGASISVNGACLTVVAVGDGLDATISFDVVAQTLAVTSLGRLRVGDGVNLEHAATPMTFLGGHVVLGHVDGLAEVVEVLREGEWRVRVRLPESLSRFAVERGSITLDGVSLTIARVEVAAVASTAMGDIIDVCLIPETLARTTLAAREVGDVINLEVDYLAKLVARQLEWMQSRVATRD